MRAITLLLALLVVAPSTPAAWEGEVQFGLVSNRGNTDSDAANLRVRAANERQRWRHRLRFSALKDAESGETTAERYLFDGNVNYILGERDYIFGNLRYDRDRFSGFDSQTSLTSGYGYLFKPRPNLSLELHGGGGARRSRLDDGEREDEAILRGLLLVHWEISDNAQFKQSLVLEEGEDNTLTESFTELKVNVVHKWAVSLSLDIKRNSNPPAGNKNTDSRTSVNLVYEFGKRNNASETK
jgi:putative salt-induced outer membrane protein